MASASQRLQFLLSVDAKGAVKGFEDTSKAADRELKKVDDRFDQMGAKFTTFGAGALAAAGVAFAGLSKLASAASDVEESINAVEVTYGDAAAGILALSESAATAVGLPKAEFNQLAVSFKAFADTIAGQQGSAVEDVVGELTTRIADFASVMNLDVPEAARIFQSALAGETEPVRKFGIDLSAATVQQYALSAGIIDTARELTESEKVLARYGLILESTDSTAGDFENTSDSLANQQRILNAEFQDLQADIGAGLLPIFSTMLGAVKGVVNVFSELDESTKGVAGQVLGFGTVALGAVGGVSLLVGQIIKMRKAFQALNLVMLKTPVGLLAAAMAGLAVAFGVFSGSTRNAEESVNDIAAAMRDAASDADGLTDKLNEMVMETPSWAKLLDDAGVSTADLSEALLEGGDAVNAMAERLLEANQDADGPQWDRTALIDFLQNLSSDADTASKNNEVLNRVISETGDDADGASEAIDALTEAQSDAEREAQELAEALEEEIEALEGAAEAARDQESAINDMADAHRASADQAFSVRKAQRDFKQQLDETNLALLSGELSAEEQQIALDDLALSAADAADAQVDLAASQAEASGQALTGSERTKLFNESLVAQAAQASGPTRQAIIDYIAEVNNIPESKASEIQALIDQGKLDEAMELLNNTSATRNAQINAEANTDSAENELEHTRRNRTAYIDAVVRPQLISGTLPWYVQDALRRRHVGGRVSPGDLVQPLSGEMFVPDQPGRIVSREDTGRMLEAGAQQSGVTVNVTVNNPRSEDDVRRAVSRALALAELQS